MAEKKVAKKATTKQTTTKKSIVKKPSVAALKEKAAAVKLNQIGRASCRERV